MVSHVVQRLRLVLLCVLILANLRLDNGMIEAHAIKFDLNVGRPSEVVAAIHEEHLEIPLWMSDMPAQLIYRISKYRCVIFRITT